ncbi:peptidoglycan/LPS O-acetylase OafA/YrhL [Bradyrhizobium sp. LB7.1]
MRAIPEKLYNLQALRAFACLVVALGHITIPIPLVNESPDGLFGHGPCGVDVFFVISGFIMVYATRQGDVSPVSFAYQRLARILPLYYLTTIVIFAGATIAPHLFPNLDKSTIHLAMSLLFLPS